MRQQPDSKPAPTLAPGLVRVFCGMSAAAETGSSAVLLTALDPLTMPNLAPCRTISRRGPLILTSKHLQTLTHRSSHRAAPGNSFILPRLIQPAGTKTFQQPATLTAPAEPRPDAISPKEEFFRNPTHIVIAGPVFAGIPARQFRSPAENLLAGSAYL
jgi:hypothetical protein